MCTAQSNPSMELNGVNEPTITATPIVDQPPLFWKWSKASCALLKDGAFASKGITTANTPATCSASRHISTTGNFFATAVLKRMANVTAAITNSVPCHL